MNLALWIAAGVLAAVLLVAAINKLVIPQEKLATFPGGDGSKTSAPALPRRSHHPCIRAGNCEGYLPGCFHHVSQRTSVYSSS